MRTITLSKAAKAARLTRRFRCGVQFDATAAAFPEDRFTPREWAQIEADPMLAVIDEGAAKIATPEGADLDLRQRIIAAIANLSADEFIASGAPDLGALRAALPDDAKAITAALRDEVWEDVKANANGDPAPETDTTDAE
ncbi:hypothetical protein ACVDG3_06950 [Meridianimarinicoccus sp. RP-17]|uniref:hypothetical protein n=1 Tax=Meridianimarinicoccus zhengii TaxID=2056810 RepID=UPI000DAE5C8C|nr:hypothetical protein [Phycocomes zhengii]